MKTLFACLMLVLFGVAAWFVSVFILNVAGIPGALLAGKPGQRSVARFRTGAIVAAMGQSYVYLSYVAFVVSWAGFAARRDDTIGWLIWGMAFLVAVKPIWWSMIAARVEAQEAEYGNPQVEALVLTALIAIVAFPVFAFVPEVMRVAWGWVPYVV